MAGKTSRETARENISELRKITEKISKLNGQIHKDSSQKSRSSNGKPDKP